ncbi:MAG: serine hydrolase, partial [Clostridia bacterium]|nr:serine hydrolase [Clostridia bacterium]
LPPYMGCACIKSTVEDLSLYYRMLANGGMHEGKRIVPAEAVEQMVGAQYPLRRKPFYAMGLRKRLVGGKMACDHGGELHGVSAFGGFLEGGYGVAILCNESEWDMEELQNTCYAFLLGLPLDEDLMWTRPCGRDFSRPDTLWGDYVGHVGKPSHIRIFSRDGRLRADVGGTLCRLEYCEGTVFAAFGEASGKRVCFLRFVLKDGRAWAVKCGSLLYRRV